VSSSREIKIAELYKERAIKKRYKMSGGIWQWYLLHVFKSKPSCFRKQCV